MVDNKDMAFLSREVATIVCDLDFPLDLEECCFPSFDPERVTEAFKKVQFNAHLSRVLKLVGRELEKKAAPVSYTHLDVYKRQHQRTPSASSASQARWKAPTT